MTFMKRLEPIWLLVVIIGCLNWAVLALFDTNMVSEVFGSGTATDVVYVIIGFAALMFVPRLMDEMHISRPHAHGH